MGNSCWSIMLIGVDQDVQYGQMSKYRSNKNAKPVGRMFNIIRKNKLRKGEKKEKE